METKELVRELLGEIGRLYDRGAKIQFDALTYEKRLLVEKNEELERKVEKLNLPCKCKLSVKRKKK